MNNAIKQMLERLHDSGLSDAEISRRTEIPQPTVSRLRSGIHADTSYTYGKRIEQLFASFGHLCGEGHQVMEGRPSADL